MESTTSVAGSTPSFESVPTQVTVKTLLEAGAHFGHQAQRWNPRMLPYIYTERNGVHIINLDITMRLWLRARKYIVDTVSRGGTVLFVGTKPQAREIIAREATRCGAFFTTARWLGGTLTNFQTIKNSIDRMRRMQEYLVESEKPDSKIKLVKKEKVRISKELEKLEGTLGGIRNMKRPPDLIFVVDINKEEIAIAEARRLHIPVVALVDTNVDPELVQFPIPSNDDAARTIQLFIAAAADAVAEGRIAFEARVPRGQDRQDTKADAKGFVAH